MRRWTVALTALVMLAAGLPAQATDHQRAMWVWEGPSAEVLQFSLDHGIDRLFLSAPPGFSSDDGYRAFLEGAAHSGVEVFALAGDPSWAQQSRRSTPFADWVEEVVDFGGFDGLAPDVEPYLHPDWNHHKKRDKLVRSYLSSLADASSRSGALPVIPAVPFWFDDPGLAVDSTPLIDDVMALVDGIAVMAYRDTATGPNGIIALSEYEVSLGASIGKEVIIGVETAASGEYPYVTFFEEGNAAMETELSLVSAEFGGAIWGIAIHHYRSYLDLTD